MKFEPWYRIEYGFFFKERFLGTLKQLQPHVIEVNEVIPYEGTSGSYHGSQKTEFNDKKLVQEFLQNIDQKEVISYRFELENGVLREKISLHGSHNSTSYVLTTRLNTLKQELFLRNIFKFFGVYLAIHIKDYDYHLTTQEYILNELKCILKKHSPHTTTCGNYTIILKDKNQFSSIQRGYLGIDAAYDGNNMNELDNRKGMLLYVYLDDETKKNENDNNFIVNEETFKRFSKITKDETRICSYLLKSLRHESKAFDLLYNFNLDYPEANISI